MSLEDFVHRTSSYWMRADGPEDEMVMSTRVRLARNLADLPFPMLATEGQMDEVLERVNRALRHPSVQDLGHFEMLPMNRVHELDREVLMEKHLISPDLVEHPRRSAVVLRDDEIISIMVGEEDHLRIQCLFPGLQLKPAWDMASRVDDALEATLDWAYDEKRGYLTACPTNVGTGMRASVMMHLPALVMTDQIRRVLHAISQVGLAVRGIYGEGTEAVGNLFQVSNQITLGQSEEEIVHNLYGVTRQLIEHERRARQLLLEQNRPELEDRIGRSYGILRYAKRLDSKETMQRLSDVRLGIDLGIITGVPKGILKELMVLTRPALLQTYEGRELSPQERDVHRAALIRERLRALSA
ncbi:protein arginine kinase [Kyrpidia sp.]|uniref:protein arginine kinase n=1 Tax=Kyrpidia sp. TaxID=2073077 RepID=UPI00258A6591|nr:protein arginine kinase [Kyrpidia sp.]MCL6575377.1 protein arginine kinase [Kyrpidia sp.]